MAKKKQKLKANDQDFHDEKTCVQLTALFHAQRVASSTARRPDGSLAGFVPPKQAALRWQDKVGKDAIEAFLEGIGYLADTTLSTADKDHEISVTSRKARQRARAMIVNEPALQQEERSQCAQDLAEAGCEGIVLSQEAATQAQKKVDKCAPGFASWSNAGGDGYTDPITRKPCVKTAWTHVSQTNPAMHALGLTKADFAPENVEATQHGLTTVLDGIHSIYGEDVLVLGSSVVTDHSGPNSSLSTMRLETHSAQKAKESDHLVCTQRRGYVSGTTSVSEVVAKEIETSCFESSCTMIHTAKEDIGVPATLENCRDGFIVNWNETHVGEEPIRQLCTFCNVENAAYSGWGKWNWHVCGAADCLRQVVGNQQNAGRSEPSSTSMSTDLPD